MLGPKRKIEFTEHDFSAFREMRRVLGGTINDLVLTIITEGAARYLAAHGEHTANQKLRIMCPVNVRTESGEGDMGNRVSAIFPMFPAYPMDLMARHLQVCAETQAVKSSGAAQAITALQENAPPVPPVGLAPLLLVGTPYDPTRMLADNPPPVPPQFGARPPSFGINFVVTNVPSVMVPQYLAGHRISGQTTVMMMSGNLGLGVAVISFNQKLIINLTSDPRLLPDLELLDQHINDVVAELLTMVREQPAA